MFWYTLSGVIVTLGAGVTLNNTIASAIVAGLFLLGNTLLNAKILAQASTNKDKLDDLHLLMQLILLDQLVNNEENS